jgi:hypothetical protein
MIQQQAKGGGSSGFQVSQLFFKSIYFFVSYVIDGSHQTSGQP